MIIFIRSYIVYFIDFRFRGIIIYANVIRRKLSSGGALVCILKTHPIYFI